MFIIVYYLIYIVKALVFPNQVSVYFQCLCHVATICGDDDDDDDDDDDGDDDDVPHGQVFETEVLIDQGAYRGPKQHHF